MTVKVIGGEELHFKLTEGVPKPIKRMMFHIRGAALKKAKEEAKPHAGDVGSLANSIKGAASVSGKIPLSARVWTNLPVAVEVEQGRKPGKPPGFRGLQRWMKRHGIDASPKNVAVLRRSIRARGTEGVHFMEKAGDATRARLSEFIEEAERAIKAEWDK